MKRKTHISAIPFIWVASFTVACMSTGAKPETHETPTESVADLRKKAATETKEAVAARREYAYAQRAEFVEEMTRQHKEIEADLDRLSAQIEQSSDESKAKAKVELEVVRHEWAQTKIAFAEAESATEATWDDLKGKFRKSRENLKLSFDQTRQRWSDKIAPEPPVAPSQPKAAL